METRDSPSHADENFAWDTTPRTLVVRRDVQDQNLHKSVCCCADLPIVRFGVFTAVTNVQTVQRTNYQDR